MPNLIHTLFLSPPHKQLVWEIQHKRIAITNVLVRVYNSWGHCHKNRVLLPYVHRQHLRITSLPVFPKVQSELARKKDKAIGLIFVLVRAARNTGMSQAYVAHGGLEPLGQLVIAKSLNKPASGVRKLAQ